MVGDSSRGGASAEGGQLEGVLEGGHEFMHEQEHECCLSSWGLAIQALWATGRWRSSEKVAENSVETRRGEVETLI